jgi:hypothetical protein
MGGLWHCFNHIKHDQILPFGLPQIQVSPCVKGRKRIQIPCLEILKASHGHRNRGWKESLPSGYD